MQSNQKVSDSSFAELVKKYRELWDEIEGMDKNIQKDRAELESALSNFTRVEGEILERIYNNTFIAYDESADEDFVFCVLNESPPNDCNYLFKLDVEKLRNIILNHEKLFGKDLRFGAIKEFAIPENYQYYMVFNMEGWSPVPCAAALYEKRRNALRANPPSST